MGIGFLTGMTGILGIIGFLGIRLLGNGGAFFTFLLLPPYNHGKKQRHCYRPHYLWTMRRREYNNIVVVLFFGPFVIDLRHFFTIGCIRTWSRQYVPIAIIKYFSVFMRFLSTGIGYPTVIMGFLGCFIVFLGKQLTSSTGK